MLCSSWEHVIANLPEASMRNRHSSSQYLAYIHSRMSGRISGLRDNMNLGLSLIKQKQTSVQIAQRWF